MSKWMHLILHLFFPRRCTFCERVINPDELYCDYCKPDIPYMSEPLCQYCGRSKEYCECRKRRHHYDRCFAAMRYEDGAAYAVLSQKQYNYIDRTQAMAVEMVKTLRRHTDAAVFDIVTCVPMYPKEQRDRGFNQSEYLAKEIASMLGVPFARTLRKIYDTRSQKSLRKIERNGNLLGAFDVTTNVKGQHILLVDDVITTGATLHECAKMLKIREAKSVTALCYAATVNDPDKDAPAKVTITDLLCMR